MLYVIQSYDRFQIQISKICAGCPYPAKVGPLETDFTEIGLALLRERFLSQFVANFNMRRMLAM